MTKKISLLKESYRLAFKHVTEVRPKAKYISLFLLLGTSRQDYFRLDVTDTHWINVPEDIAIKLEMLASTHYKTFITAMELNGMSFEHLPKFKDETNLIERITGEL